MKGEPNHLRLLYHYTSEANLTSILKDGVLLVSRGSAGREFAAGPLRVVWLTDAMAPGSGNDHGLRSPEPRDPAQDKRGVRITVSVSYAQHWAQWARRRRVGRRQMREIDEAGGGLSQSWWIAPHPIPAGDWVRIENLHSGEVVWPRPVGAVASTRPVVW
ncbi:MAG: hypothetical protein M3O28_10195 [Actinomycetota bacterium]|nr:hypothetical protein [Actinomycetota bacterium]